MGISPDEVRRIAELAALRLDDDEVDRLAGELADILGHFEALGDLDTGQHRDTEEHRDTGEHRDTEEHGDTGTALRPDEVAADPLDSPPGEGAPEFEGGFFTVPRLEYGAEDAEERGDAEGAS